MARDLIDLGMVSRLSGVPRYLASRHVRDHGPEPVGRIGIIPYWNIQDLDALLAAVEQGKARDKSKALIIVTPDENDALDSRVQLYKNGEFSAVYISGADGDRVPFETLRDYLVIVGMENIDDLRALHKGDEVKVAHTIADVIRESHTTNA